MSASASHGRALLNTEVCCRRRPAFGALHFAVAGNALQADCRAMALGNLFAGAFELD
ncbi:MAG: hypothetical protein WBM40_14350 [Thiohalocapsa sp.]